MNNLLNRSLRNRRSFLKSGVMAGTAAIGGALVTSAPRAFAAGEEKNGSLPKGDAAILRFLAAAELIEADFWEQYNELGGIQDVELPGGSGNPIYTAKLVNLDMDMPQYIHDNTEDEVSHHMFLNAYLASKGADMVNLDQFRTLIGSQADGADKSRKRLTNLMELTIDTTWWTRYRSRDNNPDLGGTFPPAIPGLLAGAFPAIPRDNSDLPKDAMDVNGDKHIQAIANTAGFHFATIEQGGSSLYPSLAQHASDPEVLRILLSIGPTETSHFQTWHDKAGNAPPLTDPTNGLVFPDLNQPPQPPNTIEDFQTNLIMPEPCPFIPGLPKCSIIRPTQTKGAAKGAIKFLTDMGLFINQTPGFFALLQDLAEDADDATRTR